MTEAYADPFILKSECATLCPHRQKDVTMQFRAREGAVSI